MFKKPQTTSPSLARRAILAVGLILGFYPLAIGIAAGLLYLPYAEVVYTRHLHQEHQQRALGTLGAALAVAFTRQGWTVQALPGEPVLLQQGESRLHPFDTINHLASGALTPDAWHQQCLALHVADAKLA